MAFLKQWFTVALSPVGIMTLLFAVGLLFSLFRRRSAAGRRMILTGTVLMLIFLLTPVPELLVADLERPFPPLLHPQTVSGLRMILVLSHYGEDRPTFDEVERLSPESVIRVLEGIRLYRILGGTKLVLSGGVLREGDRPVARLMADFCRVLGVPQRDILTEENSSNTHENLVEAQKMIGSAPFLLVTSASHMRRALAVANRLGMSPTAAPADYWTAPYQTPGMTRQEWLQVVWGGFLHPSTRRFQYLQRAYHENLGYLWYRLRGWV
jgi:uncharacterized SAM-binding protein YcdF (DUF218 family)